MRKGKMFISAILIACLFSCAKVNKKEEAPVPAKANEVQQAETNKIVNEKPAVKEMPVLTNANPAETNIAVKEPAMEKKETIAANIIKTDNKKNEAALLEQKIKNFNTAAKDIRFIFASYKLQLSNMKYAVGSQNIEAYLKMDIISPLREISPMLPKSKKIIINGYASASGKEKPTKYFIGNIALSQKRAEAVLNYILKNSTLDRSQFTVKANGSGGNIPGISPNSNKNCRVHISIE